MAAAADPLRARRRTALASAAVAVAMVGLAFASVPLYRAFCQATGFAGTTGRAVGAPDAAEVAALGGKTIKIRFDANVSPLLGWKFAPRDPQETIRIGEKRLAFFIATNLTDRPLTGRAVFNVSPDTAGQYFRKIECFCFTEQTLAPHETAQMPVTYYVDPSILKDAQDRKIDEITLSYTFYPVDSPASTALSASGTSKATGNTRG